MSSGVQNVADQVSRTHSRSPGSHLPGAAQKHALQLVDAYLEWALGNPKVLEVLISWADTLPGAERAARIFERKGFHKIGETWERASDEAADKEAA